jgi:hypothetical protein
LRLFSSSPLPLLDESPLTRKITKGFSPLFGAPCRRVDCVEEHMPLINKAKRDRIRELNDALRTSFDPKLGKIVMTSGFDALASDVKAMAIRKVVTFSDFSPDNDPHKEHDFGSFELAGQSFFWKIDYYDSTLAFGSDDPSDPELTTRVLTLMLAEEY